MFGRFIFATVSLISALSIWRLLAILGPNIPLAGNWWLVWLGLTLALILLWLVLLILLRQLTQKLPKQGQFTTLIGVILFAGGGFLLGTPAGLAKLTLELYAENVWSPQMFTATWTGVGLWDTPFTLPTHSPTATSLKIVPSGRNEQAQGSEVWLVDAVWPDGSPLPLEQFQVEDGWELRTIDWASNQQQSVWINIEGKPAPLRWSGTTSGPLTLLFAKHNRAGQVTVHGSEASSQSFDLFAPDIAFQGVTLSSDAPVVWRAALPYSALSSGVGFSLTPDPADNFSVKINKIRLTGIPGQSVEARGTALAEIVRSEVDQPLVTETGIQFISEGRGKSLQLFLGDPFVSTSIWLTVLPWLENLLLALYLGLMGGLVFASFSHLIKPGLLTNGNLIAVSLLLTLLLSEIGLRFFLPPTDKFYVWRPNLYEIFKPSSDIMPGINGEAHFIINSEGIRADEFSEQDGYRILAIGGSTTESLFLDRTEAWPQLVQDILNEKMGEPEIWVGNVGKAGRNTREHIFQMQHLLPQYPDLDAVLLLIGVNDFILRLELGDDYNPDYLTIPGTQQALIQRAFDVYPQQDPNTLTYYQQTAIARLFDRIQQARQPVVVAEAEIQNENGSNIIKRREARNVAVIQEALPDLSTSLDEYTRNVNMLVDIAQAHNLRVILLTQPFMWGSELSQAERDLLWLGWSADEGSFYSVEALATGLGVYNQRLLQICQQRQLECIDVAAALPKDTTVFYDDVHFNERGSALVAEEIAHYLLNEAPIPLTR